MATKAASQKTQLGIIKEVTFGTTPATPQLLAQRHSDTAFTLNIEQLQDESKTAARQYFDISQGNKTVTGTINGPFSHNNYDTLLECGMLNTWATNSLALGNTRVSLTIEEGQPDINEYFVYRGFVGNSFSISAPNDGIVTFSMEGMAVAEANNSTTISAASYTPFADRTAYTHCRGTVTEGGTPIAYVSGVELTVNNNYSTQNVWGECDASDLVEGRAQVTGTLTVFFVDTTLYNKFVSGAASSLSFVLSDGTNTMTFTMPKIKYTAGDKPSANSSDPRTITLSFEAFAPSSVGSALTITRSA